MENLLPIVDKKNRPVGLAPRSVCHGHPGLVHCSVHIIITDSAGRLLLQKRSKTKDIQPGKWDTSVGGHLDPGDNFYRAAKREMAEELGIKKLRLVHLYDYMMSNTIETESIRTYSGIYDGPLHIDKNEIDEVKFWPVTMIRKKLGGNTFTPNFKEEFRMFLEWRRKNLPSLPVG